jgi:hypothetical protein
MSFKLLQFSPEASTRVRMRGVPERWTRGYEYSHGATFLPSWMDVDPDPAWVGEKRHVNWGAISGLAISMVVGGGFWVGLGLLVAKALR